MIGLCSTVGVLLLSIFAKVTDAGDRLCYEYVLRSLVRTDRFDSDIGTYSR